MKRNIKKAVILVIYFCLIFICTKVYATTGTTIKETVRLRQEASTDSKIIELIATNQEVEIIEEEGEWYKVKYNDGENTYTGYIRKDMLEVEGQSDDSQDDDDNAQDNENQDDDDNAQDNDNQDDDDDVQNDDNDNQNIEEGKQITLASDVEIRIFPVINSSKIGTIKSGEEVVITEIVGKWSYIEASSQRGWAITSKLVQKSEESNENEENQETDNEPNEQEDNNETTDSESTGTENTDNNEEKTESKKEMYVKVNTLNLREKADSSSKILQQLSINEKVTVIEEVDDSWSKVEVSGITGYVATKYLSETKTETTSRGNDETRDSSEETDEEDDDDEEEDQEESQGSESDNSEEDNDPREVTGEDIVAYAKTFIGCPYVYGGTSPSGFDCSGFTQYVYKHFGYSISRTSSSQRSDGISVKKADLIAGDIVCFNGHVGIYVGNNKFVHAENPANGVKISSLAETYYTNNYITARRIIY